MTDLVVLYCSDKDEEWKREYLEYREEEIEEGRNFKDNKQAFGEERTRDWDNFKYWFRGVEKNCKWVNRVFLIVQRESQIPKWINRDNPKLRIVFHEEYIPKELLPTFNTNTIQFYISNIRDLSEQYILCDDDAFFTNEILDSDFYIDGKPIKTDSRRTYELLDETGLDGEFLAMLNTNYKFERRFIDFIYNHEHFPVNRLKSFEQHILKEFGSEIYEHLSVSRFRHPYHFISWLYDDLLRIFGKTVVGNPYFDCSYVSLNSKIDLESFKDSRIVCLNDNQLVSDFYYVKNKVNEFLEELLPDKSSFEV